VGIIIVIGDFIAQAVKVLIYFSGREDLCAAGTGEL
jgi:hypothetical protein